MDKNKIVNIDNSKRKKAIMYIVLVIFLAIFIEVILLGFVSKNSANRTATVLLNQVKGIIEENDQTEQNILNELKKEYIVRAQTVAYILDANEEAQNNINELLKIAKLMQIDEIHLFNQAGKIYSGTEPKYYGYSFDSGEQMSYFKPMLKDHNLSMCQDVTPNTAEHKSMMYAITWDEKGSKMIQIGIEPIRLLEELNNNEIPKVIDRMPVYDDLEIYIITENTGEICGATDKNMIGKRAQSIGLPISEILKEDSVQIEKYHTYCMGEKVGKYVVVVTYSVMSNLWESKFAIIIEMIYLFLASIVIYFMIDKSILANDERMEHLSIMVSMSSIYYSMHLIDIGKNIVKEYITDKDEKMILNFEEGADELIHKIMEHETDQKYLEQALDFTNIHSLSERMNNKKIISEEFLGKKLGWFIASFITIEDIGGKPDKVMYVIRSIDDEKKREEVLIAKTNTDEMTGLLNRRAYENDIMNYQNNPLEENFVYVSFDVNGLKNVNDTLGHIAGDELIIGACVCIKRCFGNYGKLYRIGGDEFVAIIFANETELHQITNDFDEMIMNWSGIRIKALSVSYGYISKKEADTNSIYEIAILADKKMYEDKTKFYQRKGFDRRGQAEAHIVLCSLYTKILKINITRDSYQIINMTDDKDLINLEVSNKISEWLNDFGKSGQVHPEDLDFYFQQVDLENIRKHFKKKNQSFAVFYRRKYEDGYKKVMMEMIPTSEYTDEDQQLFLYVKIIDNR